MEFKPNLPTLLKPSYGYGAAKTSLATVASSDKSPTTLVGNVRIQITDLSLTNSYCDGSMANLVRGLKEADNTDDTTS